MDKTEMIKAIYEKIADKTLSFGCKIIIHPYIKKKSFYLWNTENEDSCMWGKFFYVYHYYQEFLREYAEEYSDDFEINKIHSIIWHPVMINRIEYVLPKNDYLEIRQSISKEELLLPIDDWNIESINLLYKKVWF